MVKPGKYKAANELRVRMGVSSFTIPAGAEIEVGQQDNVNHKQIVTIGRDSDWLYEGDVDFLVGVELAEAEHA